MVNISLPNRLKSHGNGAKASPSQDLSRSSSPNRAASEPRSKPLLSLKITVLRARNLAARDKNGTSDPFIVAMLDDARYITHAISKTLNPEWNVTFELPITGVRSLLLQCVCWDKDRFGKDYLGEFDVSLEEAFANGQVAQEPKWYSLRSSRKKSKISGEVQLQFTLVDPSDPNLNAEPIMQKFQTLADTSLDGEEGGEDAENHRKLDSSRDDLEDEPDDDDEGEDTSDETDDPTRPEAVEKKRRRLRLKSLRRRKKARAYEFSNESDVVGILFLEISKITDLPPERNVTRTSFDMDPFVVASIGKKTYRTRVIRHNLNPVFDERMLFQVLLHEQSYSLNFSIVDRDKLSGNDLVGTAIIPLQQIISTAPEADPETGLYQLKEPPSPSVPTPVPRSRFRLPVSRTSSSTSLTKANSRPGPRTIESSSALPRAPQSSDQPMEPSSPALPSQRPPPTPISMDTASSDNVSSLSIAQVQVEDDGFDAEGDPELLSFALPLSLKHKEKWEAKNAPELSIRAKYVPYPALRQHFWRALLRQYDVDDNGRISKVELATMLDTLGSTLHNSTINGFFTRFAANDGASDPNNAELTFDQTVVCLEDQLQEASREKTWGEAIRSRLPTSLPLHLPNHLPLLPGMPHVTSSQEDASESVQAPSVTTSSSAPSQSQFQMSIPALQTAPPGSPGEEGEMLGSDDLDDERGEEHVIEILECPICHQPRMNKKSDADIITHIATCASHDWRRVNNIVMAGFVTPSQAQRKWYSKVITKISYGGYRIGANSANILVQDRITGQINEERMSVYVRLGIRLLYKGLKSREMEKKRIRKLLRSLSIKQGKKYDDPASVREIASFVNFHRLNMSEVLRPMDQFKSFNEFFYRELKPNARPCSAPDNPRIIVSPADCRSVVFDTMNEATTVWVKGREFSISRLLGNTYPEDARRYVHGALGIFRLAPQDYHRFHVPVDGVMDTPKQVPGEYYTVNPMAIRSALDVYGENVRVVVPIDSVAHGRVMVICVGAMMVGSTVITAKAGDQVKRAQELGYFKFGGSTLLLLFEPGMMKFDPDLVDNSSGALETLIRVGMSIGHHPDQPAHLPDRRKEHVTMEEKAEAKRRIQGSMTGSTSPIN